MRYLIVCLLLFSQLSYSQLDLTYTPEWDWEQIKEDAKRIEAVPGIFDNVEWQNYPSELDWTIFVTLQVLDVYTTYRGLKYDCVSELNPIFGQRPSLDRMVLTKLAILYPAVEYDIARGNWQQKDIRSVNTFMAFVVGNNLTVMREAEKICIKR